MSLVCISSTDDEVKVKEEIVEMQKEVQEYKPGDASTCPDQVNFPEELHIGLFGRTGCGKTSLINSLKFAAHGELKRSKWLQVAGQEKGGGHTMFRRLADITRNIWVIDNRGLDDPDTDKAIGEIEAQLDGKRGYTDIIKWQTGNAEQAGNGAHGDEPVQDELLCGDRIGCAVFVFSASHDLGTNSTGLIEVVNFLHGHQGRYPVAVITHVDKNDGKVVESLKTILRVAGVSDIFEVANITNNRRKLDEAYQHSLLSLLERCMTDGDETLIFQHYQQKQNGIEKKRGEIKRTQEQEREAEEDRQRAERERVEQENKMRQQIEEHLREIERHRERAEKLEREKQDIERERQVQEEIAKMTLNHKDEMFREKEKNFQEKLDQVQVDNDKDLQHMMEDNRRQMEANQRTMAAAESRAEKASQRADVSKQRADEAKQEIRNANQRAEESKQRADEAKQETWNAKQRADEAKQETSNAKQRADAAKQETSNAKQRADEARQETREAKRKEGFLYKIGVRR